MNRHRAWILAVVVGAALFIPSTAGRAATALVLERGVQFSPAQITVAAGDTVSWVFESSPAGSPGHTVTFSDRDLNPNCPPQLLLNDCQRSPGDRVSRTFGAAGTYPYYCKIHRSQGMTGVVVVTTASSSTATTTASSSTTSTTARATTTTTVRATSSTTSTTRVLATSSTLVKSTTTTADTSNVLLPGAPPSLSGDDGGSNAARKSGGSGGSDTSTVALIVGLLLVVSGGGGYLLWRLRPGRG